MYLGIDMVEIARIEKALAGPGFRDRVYRPAEIEYCESRKKNKFQSYAGMYAAKEAFVKALGTGFRYGSWQDIEVGHDELGAPVLSISGPFKSYMEEKGLRHMSISITHTDSLALCQVILD
mgnify:FL=1